VINIRLPGSAMRREQPTTECGAWLNGLPLQRAVIVNSNANGA